MKKIDKKLQALADKDDLKVYTLDVAKWRCGSEGASTQPGITLGQGDTLLLNDEGYMCCLGQFAEQKLKRIGVPKEEIHGALLGRNSPDQLAHILGFRYDSNLVELGSGDNSGLSVRLIVINDNCRTQVSHKIREIRADLKEHGLELRVINQHLIPQ